MKAWCLSTSQKNYYSYLSCCFPLYLAYRLPLFGSVPASVNNITASSSVADGASVSTPTSEDETPLKSKFFGVTYFPESSKSAAISTNKSRRSTYHFSQKTVTAVDPGGASGQLLSSPSKKSPTKWYNQFLSKKSNPSAAAGKSEDVSVFKKPMDHYSKSPKYRSKSKSPGSFASPRSNNISNTPDPLNFQSPKTPNDLSPAGSNSFKSPGSLSLGGGSPGIASGGRQCLKSSADSPGRMTKFSNKLKSPGMKLSGLKFGQFGARGSPGRSKLPMFSVPIVEKSPPRSFLHSKTSKDTVQTDVQKTNSSIPPFDYKTKEVWGCSSLSKLTEGEEFMPATAFFQPMEDRSSLSTTSLKSQDQMSSSSTSTSGPADPPKFTPQKPPRPSLTRGTTRRRSSIASSKRNLSLIF